MFLFAEAWGVLLDEIRRCRHLGAVTVITFGYYCMTLSPLVRMQRRTSVGVLGVLGGALCHLVLGTTYCWGNFVPYVPKK